MTGWVTISRIKWILKNKVEVKFPDPTTRACLIVDSDGAGMIYYKEASKEDIEVLLRFHNQDELDEIFDSFQNNLTEVKLEEKTKKFCVVRVNPINQPQSSKEHKETKKQGPLFDLYGDSGDNPDGDILRV